MKKSFILASLVMAGVLSTQAENTIYTYANESGVPYYGFLNRISDNGRWAVGADDGYGTGSFIIDVENPEEPIFVPDGELYDVADDGTCVGALYFNGGTPEAPVNYKYGAIYKDGVWEQLPFTLEVVGQYYARAINSDASVISGMAFCKDVENGIGGKYYPCIWTKDSYGDWTMTAFCSLDLPSNMGFYVNDMTDDGSILVGTINTYAGSTIPAMLDNGMLKIWNKLEVKEFPFYFNGELITDSDGNPILYESGMIDGILEGYDTDKWFEGTLNFIYGDYAFGHRSVGTDANPQTGEGTVTHYRSIYNMKTDEFIDEVSNTFYSCGVDAEHAFTSNNFIAYYVNNGYMQKVSRVFGVSGDIEPGMFYGCDKDGRVFAGCGVFFNDLLGEYCETPLLMVLDEGISSVADITVDAESNIKDKAVYDINGRRVLSDRSNASELAPGIYFSAGKKFVVK